MTDDAIATTEVKVEKCSCGHRGCRSYWLVGYGSFCQGSGFTKSQAQNIAKLLNDQARDKYTCEVMERQL
jgi:hypothetical protein